MSVSDADTSSKVTDDQRDWVASTLGVDPRQYGAPGAPGAGADQPGFRLERRPSVGPDPANPDPLPGSPAADLDITHTFDAAAKRGDWQSAAQIANGLSPQDLKARIAGLSADDVAELHKGAIANKAVGQNSAVARATAALSHPIMGEVQSRRAKTMEGNLSEDDKTAYHALLDAAKNEKQKQYLTKALAAGYTIAQIKAFDDKIAGKDDKWMQDNLSLTGNSEGKGVKQQWSMSCNATAEEAVRGEMDPIYALMMHEQNPHLTEAKDDDGAGLNPSLAADQKKQLESADPAGHSGRAVNRGYAGPDKIPGRWNTDLLNNVEGVTGISYKRQKIGPDVSLEDGVKSLNASIDKGMPVPIVVGDGGDNIYAHYVVITASDPGPPRYYSIHDPATGDTQVRSEDELKTGKLGVSWNKISVIESPTEIVITSKPK